MAQLLLLDTSVLIAAERQSLPVGAIAKPEPEALLAMSVITVAELLQGLHRAQSERQRRSRGDFIADALARMTLLPVDLSVAREHARIWANLAGRGQMIGAYDLIIAATALVHRAALATLNVSEFKRVEGWMCERSAHGWHSA
jgi:tRNA(fMet)-specific endonuclease VapC